jgi:hypothetical protein
MDADRIIDQLANQKRLPVEAMRDAAADRAVAVPIFVRAIEQCLSRDGDASVRDSLFLIFHLLGEWRERSAYRPLARLLRLPPDEIDSILGGAITDTTHRVMAAVFDGDPTPLYDVILDPEADEYVRSRMLEAIAMVTLRGEMPRAEAARFLRVCYTEINPQDECFVWNGWQSAIALLGLVELKPLVEQAFARGFISAFWLGFNHFEDDLQLGTDDPTALLRRSRGEFDLFGDTVEELSSWYSFRPKEPAVEERGSTFWSPFEPRLPAINPLRNIGRNDPCPCGSGRKFKKCCLAASQASPNVLQAM